MSDLIPVDGHKHLYRDADSHAIINTNKDAWEAYKRQREADRHMIKSLDKVDKLEKEMSEIKKLLELLLTKVS